MLWLLACHQSTYSDPPISGYRWYDTYERPAPAFVDEQMPASLAAVGITDPAAREPVGALFYEHYQSWAFWGRLIQVRALRLEVLQRLREAGLPEVLMMLPYDATTYDPLGVGPGCRRGAWLLPLGTPGLEVRGCGSAWSPGDPAPVGDDGYCTFLDCALDQRLDFERSTAIAIRGLQATWERTGHDVLATLRTHASRSPYAVVAQYLLAVCYDRSVDPTLFPVSAASVCAEIEVPTAERVAAVVHR